jgi:hypothetical protein
LVYQGLSQKTEVIKQLKTNDKITILFSGFNSTENNKIYCIKYHNSAANWDGFILSQNNQFTVLNNPTIPNYNWNIALNNTNDIMAINVANEKIVLLNKNGSITSIYTRDTLLNIMPKIDPEYYTFILDDTEAGFVNNELYIKVGIEDSITLKGYLVINLKDKKMKYISLNKNASGLQLNKTTKTILYSNLPDFQEIDAINEYIKKNKEIVYTLDLNTLEEKAISTFSKHTNFYWKNNSIKYSE